MLFFSVLAYMEYWLKKKEREIASRHLPLTIRVLIVPLIKLLFLFYCFLIFLTHHEVCHRSGEEE